jgi:hypothetical protein
VPEPSIRDTLERALTALREQLERDVAAHADELTRAAADAQARATRLAAEVDALKRTLEREREQAAEQAAEHAAADMRREAEMHAQIAQLQEGARQRIEELQRDAAQERERAVQHAAATAAANVRRQADADIAQVRASAKKEVDEVRAAADAQIGEIRHAAQVQLNDAKAALQAELDESTRAANAQTEEARRRSEAELERVRAEAAAQVDEVRRAAVAEALDLQNRTDEQLARLRTEMEARLNDLRARATAEVEQARTAAAAARAEGEAAVRAARAEAEEVVIAQLASAQAETEKKIDEAVERTRTDAHQAELADAAALVGGVRRLDDARSLGDVLDTLTDAAAKVARRAAVLVIKGEKLRVRRLAGFSGDHSVDLDVAEAGIVAAVIGTGAVVARTAAASANGPNRVLPAFATPSAAAHALALPITVGGRVVAVLYGDAPKSEDSPAGVWPAALEVLARHASRVLEALTVEQATGLSVARTMRPQRMALPGPLEHGGTGDHDAARRYARLLVSEIRMYHEPDVDAGRRSRDLRNRLGEEIERARRLYEQRVPSSVRERADYFEQELIRTLADGNPALLG